MATLNENRIDLLVQDSLGLEGFTLEELSKKELVQICNDIDMSNKGSKDTLIANIKSKILA